MRNWRVALMAVLCLCLLACGAIGASADVAEVIEVEMPLYTLGENGEGTFAVSPYGSADLCVELPYEDLTYEWSYDVRTYDSTGYGSRYVSVDGANESSLVVENIDHAVTYTCYATDASGMQHQSRFNLYVENHLQATAEDGNAYLRVGPNEAATLQVTASCDNGPIRYEWGHYEITYDEQGGIQSYGPVPIVDEDAYFYTTPPITETEQYLCWAIDQFENRASVYFDLAVDNQLFATSPDDGSVGVAAGESATLTVNASCLSGEIHYQWYTVSDENGETLLSGATESTYTTDPVYRATPYYCYVQDDYGNFLTVWTNVYVENGLRIGIVGVDGVTKSVPSGGTATFEVEAACNEGPVSYQWYAEGVPAGLVAIEGETGTSFTTPALEGTYAHYVCIASDQYGNRAQLDVYANLDTGFSAEPLNGEYMFNALYGDALTFTVDAHSYGNLRYRWGKQVSYINVETGETTWSHEWITEWIEDESGASYSITATENRNYLCQIKDDLGNYDTIWFYVTIDSQLNAYPLNGETSVYTEIGQQATLQVVASVASGSLEYQWHRLERGYNEEMDYYFDEWTPIEGEQGESYVTPAVQSLQRYMCRVSDDFGNSASIEFMVIPDNGFHAWPKDNIGTVWVNYNAGAALEVEGAVRYGALHYQWYEYDMGGEEIEGATDAAFTTPPVTKNTSYYCHVTDDYGNSQDVWISVEVDNQLSAAPAAGSSYVYVAPGNVATLTVEAGCSVGEVHYTWFYIDEGDWIELENETGASIATKEITQREVYTCRVADDFGNTQYVDFFVRVDCGFNVEFVTPSSQEIEAGEMATLAVQASCDLGEVHLQWYQIVEAVDGNTPWGNEVLLPGETGDTLTVGPVNGNMRFFCRISDDYGDSGDWMFVIRLSSGFEMRSATDSHLVTVDLNESAALAVVASTKAGTLSYQWYIYDENDVANPIEGATGSSYTTSPITQRERYLCIATCTLPDTSSEQRGIVFTVGPDNKLTVTGNTYVEAPVNSDVTLQVTATCVSGQDQLRYQWYVDGNQLIEGENGSSITVNAGTASRSYWCSVTDIYGNVGSLWISVYPSNELYAYAVGGEDVSVHPNGTATLAVEAGCLSGGLSYRWEVEERLVDEDGNVDWVTTTVEGANGPTLTTKPVAQTLWYTCVVRDEYNNSRWIYFTVHVDNGLWIEGVGAEERLVAANAAELLEVRAGCDNGSVTYQWSMKAPEESEYAEIDGATGASYTTAAVKAHTHYLCTATDQYGNSESAFFDVRVDNGFAAYPVSNETQFVTVGDTVTLEVYAAANDGSVAYEWSTNVDGYTTPIEGETGNTYSFTYDGSVNWVACYVSASYGEKATIWFNIFSVGAESDIAAGQTATADIQTAGAMILYRLVPETRGVYIFSSSSSEDTFGYVFDADRRELASDDDNAEGYNFRVSALLEAGQTYYFGAKLLDSDRVGSFDVRLAFVPVGSAAALRLPADLDSIGDEAFVGIDAVEVYIPDGCTRIGAGAFANCPNLRVVHIPESVSYIGKNAFGSDVVFLCESYGTAWSYAREHDIAYAIEN